MAHTVFWFSIQWVSVSSGVIGHGLSIYCTCLHGMSHGCVNIWVARIYMPLPCTHLMRGVRIMRTISFGKRVLTSHGVSTLPGSTLEGNIFPSPFDPRSTTHVRDVKRRSEQGEAIQS
jgi:hypothetical protein